MTTDDEISISTLRAVAQAHLGSAAGELPNTPELRTVLGKEFGMPGHAAAGEGDLARAALDLLRQDPAFAEPIQLMSSQAGEPASRQRYLEPLTIAGLARFETRDFVPRSLGIVCSPSLREASLVPRTHVTSFTDNGARMSTLASRGFVSLCLDEGKTAALQPEIFDKVSGYLGRWIDRA